MPSATMTGKGQITVPKEVRDRLDLKAGDRIVFVISDKEVTFRPATSSLRDLYGLLQRKGQPARTIEEMDQGRNRALAEKHGRRR